MKKIIFILAENKDAEVIAALKNDTVGVVISIWMLSDSDAFEAEEKLAEKITEATGALSAAVGIKSAEQAAEQIWQKINSLGEDLGNICAVIPIEFLALVQATIHCAGKNKVSFVSNLTKPLSPILGVRVKKIKSKKMFISKHGKVFQLDINTGRYFKLCA